MHIKPEAAVFKVGVKTYSSEGPSQFETNLFCDPHHRRRHHNSHIIITIISNSS